MSWPRSSSRSRKTWCSGHPSSLSDLARRGSGGRIVASIRILHPDICCMSNFCLIDRDTGFLMPPSVDDWLPELHLARFVVDVVEGLDLRAMTGSYRGSVEASYHPQLLL